MGRRTGNLDPRMDGEGYTAAWYDWDRRCVCLKFWKGDSPVIRSVDFESYFLLSAEDVEKINCPVFRELVDFRPETGGNFRVWPLRRRSKSDYAELLAWIRSRGGTPLEADLSPVSRYIVDHAIPFARPRILYYDLETDPVGGWDSIETHRPILVTYGRSADSMKSIVADSIDDEGEANLLRNFLQVVGQNDVLVAWNGDAYDEIVLRARTKYHKITPRWPQVNFLDMMLLFKKYYQEDRAGKGVKVSYSLENISQTVLGKGKRKVSVPKNRMKDLWVSNRNELVEYGIEDSALLAELEDKLHYIQAHMVLSHLCGRFLSSRSLYSGYLADMFVLREGKKVGVHFPTKPGQEDKQTEPEKIEGAYIMEPVAGLHEGVVDLDFSSLYPSVVRTFNISPDTFIGMEEDGKGERRSCVTGRRAWNGAVFAREPEGVIPRVARTALERRAADKQRTRELEDAGKEGTVEHLLAKQRSDAWKVLANTASYGIMGAPSQRYYSPACAEAVTISAKEIIKAALDQAARVGTPAIMADTDSGFIVASRDSAERYIRDLAVLIDQMVEGRLGEPGLIRMKIDAIYRRLLIVRKKRYAGRKENAPPGSAPDIKGLEYVRSDSCKMARDLQREVIEYLLDSPRPSPSEAMAIVDRYKGRLARMEATIEELAFSQGLARDLKDYKSNTAHVRVAKEMLRNGDEIYTGMKIGYFVVGRGPTGTIIAAPASKFSGRYDETYYWERIWKPTLSVMRAVFGERMDIAPLGANPRQGALPIKEAGDVAVPLVLRLRGSDESKVSGVRAILMEYAGETPVRLEVEADSAIVRLNTDIRVKKSKRLVMEVEEFLGHRAYYGKEALDG